MPQSPSLSRVLDRLAGLRRRVRLLLGASGVARVVATVGVLLVAWLLADKVLRLPLGVRRFIRLGLLDQPVELATVTWVALLAATAVVFVLLVRHRSPLAGVVAFALAGVPGVLLWVIGRHIVSPLAIRLPDGSLALAVEHRFQGLRDRLAAALDFDRELAAPSRGESPAMMARVVDDAAKEVEGLRFASVASARSVGRHSIAALAAVGVFGALVASMPATAALWARRSLLLENIAWPRDTTLVAVVVDAAGNASEKDAATPYIAALGQSISVFVQAQGSVPAHVEVVDRASGAAGRSAPLAHQMRAVPGREGLFTYDFREVRGDFSFWARGGDDRDEVPEYAVEVRVPPRISALRLDLVYPAYLRLPPRRVEGGAVSVPEGTDVRVSFEVDAAVARAEAFLSTDSSAASETSATLSADGAVRSFEVKAEKTMRYRLHVATADGRENDAAADTYEISVEPDTAPRSEWVYPRGPVEVTAKGRVPLFAQTRDDHGVESLRLDVWTAKATQPVRIPLAQRTAAAPQEANDRVYGSDAILTYHPLELSAILDKDGKPLAAPTRIEVQLVAKDSKGQESLGPKTSIDVLRPDEIQRGFAGQRESARSDTNQAATDLSTIAKTVADLAAAGSNLGDPERQVLRDVQFRVSKTRGSLERVARGIGSLFTAYVYDRLGGEAPTTAILALFDRRHRATFTRASDAQPVGRRPSGIDPAGGSAPDAETDVFSWALYRDVVAARRDHLIFDTGLIDKMITVLERILDASETYGSAAHEAASAAARGAGTKEDVAALAQAIERWRDSVARALEAMNEWQNLATVTAEVRSMIEMEETIKAGLRELERTNANRKDGGR